MWSKDRATQIGIAATVSWLVVAGIYVSVDVGWGALWYVLPHEMATVVIGVLTPVIFLWLAIFFVGQRRELENLVVALRRAGETSKEIMEQVISLKGKHDQDEAHTANSSKTIEIILNKLGHVLSRQSTFLEEMARGAADQNALLNSIKINTGVAVALDSARVSLVDMSVVCTRLLTLTVGAGNPNDPRVSNYVDSLLSAYVNGDVNVFFRELNAKLRNDPETVSTLRQASRSYDKVRADISSVVQNTNRIASMMNGNDREMNIKDLYKNDCLWQLRETLTQHFDDLGNAID
jgi:hypothetical protein